MFKNLGTYDDQNIDNDDDDFEKPATTIKAHFGAGSKR